MKHEFLEDYEGIGVYQRAEQGVRLDDEFRYGVYSRVGPTSAPADEFQYGVYRHVSGVGQVPGIDNLLTALLDTEEKSGLVAVKHDKQPYAIQGLQMLRFQRTSAPGADPIVGQASYILGTLGSQWVKQFVGQGFMVMVATASVPSGNIQAKITANPATIATYATKQGGFAMVDGPAELAVAAANLKAQQQEPPACPGGQAWAPALNKCVPIEGGVEDRDDKANGSAAAADTKATPEWLVLGGVALAVVAVGAFVIKR